jgi:hypothetical protein
VVVRFVTLPRFELTTETKYPDRDQMKYSLFILVAFLLAPLDDFSSSGASG